MVLMHGHYLDFFQRNLVLSSQLTRNEFGELPRKQPPPNMSPGPLGRLSGRHTGPIPPGWILGTYVRPPRPVCLQFVTIFQFSHSQPSQWPLENRNCRKNRSFKQKILFKKLRFLSIFQFSSGLPAVDMRKLKFSLKIGVSITKLCDRKGKQVTGRTS